MAGMERFTQRARRVLSFAHVEAEQARQSSIGTEHLILGLMDEEGGMAGRVLRDLGMTPDRVREMVQRISDSPTNFDPNRIELAEETQQVLEFAIEEARRLGHHYIDAEHILLGLIRVESIGMEVLRRLGVSAEQIRRETRRILYKPGFSFYPNDQKDEIVHSTSSSQSVSSKILARVFIAHGHDNESKETVARFIESLGLKVVILNEQANRGKTIIEKFESFAQEAAFAVILLTPDDFGAPRSNPKSTKFRARQNVIYELGFFNAKLGRNRVCALVKGDPSGDVELPSDFLGVVYVLLDNAGAWKIRLAKEMKEAGLKINVTNIL